MGARIRVYTDRTGGINPRNIVETRGGRSAPFFLLDEWRGPESRAPPMAGRWAGASIPLGGASENHVSMREPVASLTGVWRWRKGLHISENHPRRTISPPPLRRPRFSQSSLTMRLYLCLSCLNIFFTEDREEGRRGWKARRRRVGPALIHGFPRHF